VRLLLDALLTDLFTVLPVVRLAVRRAVLLIDLLRALGRALPVLRPLAMTIANARRRTLLLRAASKSAAFRFLVRAAFFAAATRAALDNAMVYNQNTMYYLVNIKRITLKEFLC
jgi:hypothetical protein